MNWFIFEKLFFSSASQIAFFWHNGKQLKSENENKTEELQNVKLQTKVIKTLQKRKSHYKWKEVINMLAMWIIL